MSAPAHTGYRVRLVVPDTVVGDRGATASLPEAWTVLSTALARLRPVAVSYHGRCRVICPHALGWKNHRAMVLGYQVGGQTSNSGLDPDPRRRWRCLFIDEIEQLVAADENSWQTPDNYNPTRPFAAIDEVAAALSTTGPISYHPR